MVSIHAPARGATARRYLIPLIYWFQSTHPRGVRLHMALNGLLGLKFQSTHPRGVRLSCRCRLSNPQRFQSTHPRGVRQIDMDGICYAVTRFNPRTREGCDTKLLRSCSLSHDVSIHAPARGATQNRLCSLGCWR